MDGITKLVVCVEGDEGGASICVRGRRLHAKHFIGIGVIHEFVPQEGLVISQSWGAVQSLLDDSGSFVRVAPHNHWHLGLPALSEGRRRLLRLSPAVHDAFDVEVD